MSAPVSPKFGYGYSSGYTSSYPSTGYGYPQQSYDPYAGQYAYYAQQQADPYAAWRQYYQQAAMPANTMYPSGDMTSFQAPPAPQPEPPTSKQPSLQDLLGPNGLAELQAASQRPEMSPPAPAEAPAKKSGGIFGWIKTIGAIGLGVLGLWKLKDWIFKNNEETQQDLKTSGRKTKDGQSDTIALYNSADDKEPVKYAVVGDAKEDGYVMINPEDTIEASEEEADGAEETEGDGEVENETENAEGSDKASGKRTSKRPSSEE